jgi:acetyltransferase
MLVQFTQVDYDKDIALVAMDSSREREKMLGVARIMTKPGGLDPEFAVLVGDPWQGMGIGAALMQMLLCIAKKRGFETIWGMVLAENRTMLSLGRRLGFEMKPMSGYKEYELKIDLTKYPEMEMDCKGSVVQSLK